MVASNTSAFAVPDMESEDDGLLWADLWINIAFVLFALVSDPATSWLLPETVLRTEGATSAPGQVLVFHLEAGSEASAIVRRLDLAGEELREPAITAAVSDALSTDPETAFVLTVDGALSALALLTATSVFERAGARNITLTTFN